MKEFVISANACLSRDVQGFYHTEFYGRGHPWCDCPDNPTFLYTLKNDPHHNPSDWWLITAANQLGNILLVDFAQILERLDNPRLTVCVVPRAKAETEYRAEQLYFKEVTKRVVAMMPKLSDGTDLIKRHTNTFTTHLRKPVAGYINDGDKPYPGIALDTCHFSPEIEGRDILLVDDIYTKTVNIDEDMIQALYQHGARSVTFYAVGNTQRNI